MVASYSQVLCPVDFSRESDLAVETAVALTRRGATIHLLHVRPQPIVVSGGIHAPVVVLPPVHSAVSRETIHAHVRRLAQLDRRLGVSPARRAQYHVRAGDASRRILEFARLWEVDAIVLGTRRRHALERLALGSVATAVARRSPVPVILVNPGRPARTGFLARAARPRRRRSRARLLSV